jgi:TolB-like protein/Tfp pilus assembly protein PilF
VDVFHRPAVLFLPFEALSRSDDDALLASGLCEDIRTTLACWRSFPVVGPEALGGATGDIQHLAATVDAAYAVTGSVRRAGNRARVVARLIDASSGRELWSQTFDGNLEDVFEFQDELSRRIVSQIEPEISRATAKRIAVARPRDLATWELLAKAVDAERRGGDGYGTPEANNAQREFVSEAIERDPELCEAWARLARCYFRDFLLGWAKDGRKALKKSLQASARAVEIDPGNSIAHAYRAQCLLFGNHDPQGAFEHAREAVRLNPSNVMGHYMMGCTLGYCGEPDTAYGHYEAVLRLNPAFSAKGALYCDQMMCRALAGNLDAAVLLARKTMDVAPNYLRGLQRCASVLAHAGNLEEAKGVLGRIDELGGSFSEGYVRETYPFTRSDDLEFLIDGLRKADWNG